MAGPDSRYSYPVTDSELPSFACFQPHYSRYSQPTHTLHKRRNHVQHGSKQLSCHTHSTWSTWPARIHRPAQPRSHALQPCTRCESGWFQTPSRVGVCFRAAPSLHPHGCASGDRLLSSQHHGSHTAQQCLSREHAGSGSVAGSSSAVPTQHGCWGRSCLPCRILPAGNRHVHFVSERTTRAHGHDQSWQLFAR